MATLQPTECRDEFVIGPGIRPSGELATFRRRDDGTVDSMLLAFTRFPRLEPVSP
jgi:hypothetical protein